LAQQLGFYLKRLRPRLGLILLRKKLKYFAVSLVSNNYYEHKCIFLFAVQKKLQHEFTFYDEFCHLYKKRNSTDFENFDVDMYYSVTNLIFLQGAEFSGE